LANLVTIGGHLFDDVGFRGIRIGFEVVGNFCMCFIQELVQFVLLIIVQLRFQPSALAAGSFNTSLKNPSSSSKTSFRIVADAINDTRYPEESDVNECRKVCRA
jgi:hypothetical protein